MIGFGYLSVWKGWFTREGADVLMKFTQNFAIPCLLFSAIARLDLAADFDWKLLAVYFTAAGTCFVLGMIGARHLFGRPWPDAVAIGFVCLFANSVLLGLPITERAYGADALGPNYAIISIHAAFCYTVGIISMEIALSEKSKGGIAILNSVIRAVFRNALVLGLAAGFVVNILSIPVPGVVWDGLGLMVQAAIPAALFGLGGILVQYRPEGDLLTIAFCLLVTLVICPVLVFVGGSVSGLEVQQFRSAVLNGAMAPGVNVYVFANMYGVAKRVAASTVLLGTGLSIFTVWVWLSLLP